MHKQLLALTVVGAGLLATSFAGCRHDPVLFRS